ncbi:hypothetical protein K505DRAFT_338986 [Melanomma pulvis-pyrius CBS 109.77]|uniref:C2H2-type domain-containing protein n=1 Tax=Melanomma pulvis-pyrius CBS 109.77 TaxID=1314802 RepID=A0A6A6X707_9PLEO|nr:hypothetical protein K505DRAFT_338986 [Melanomma pulvis-pyrius CBS 109.77]
MYTSPYFDDPYLSTEVALASPLAFTAPEFEDATAQRYREPAFSDYPSLEYTSGSSSRHLFEPSLQALTPNDDSPSNITDPMSKELEELCESPGAIWNYRGLGPSIGGEPPVVPSRSWTGGWGSDVPLYQADKKLDDGFGTESSLFSYKSASSTCPTESVSSISTPIAAPSTRAGHPLSSRGSRAGDHSQYSSSEPRKKRIEPVKPSRTHTQDISELSRCEICNRHFTLRKDLKRHKLSKHSDRPKWLCPVLTCHFSIKGFMRKDKAIQHMKTHQRGPDGSLTSTIVEPVLNADEENLPSTSGLGI